MVRNDRFTSKPVSSVPDFSMNAAWDWWNRHRPWPIRERVFGLPSHPVASEAGTRLIVCCEPDFVADVAWTARSFLHRLDRAPAGRLALDLYVDSPDPETLAKTADRWTPLFPGSEVHSTWDAVEKLAPVVLAIDALANTSAAARRLAVVLHAQDESNVILAGPDVLLLGNSIELSDALHDGTTALHLQGTDGEDADAALTEYARRHGLPLLAESLDPGLLFLPRGCLSLVEAGRLLADPQLQAARLPPLDRSVLALLLGLHGARPLMPERYLASEQGRSHDERDADYSRLAARRFPPAVRHLLYAEGMPRLWRLWHEKSP